MAHLLFWLFLAVAPLALAGLLHAVAARTGHRIGRRAWIALALLAPLLPAAAAVLVAVYSRMLFVPGPEATAWLLAGVLVAGDVLLAWRAWRHAGAWDPRALAAAAAATTALAAATWHQLDTAARVGLAAGSAQGLLQMISLAPGRPVDRDNAALRLLPVFARLDAAAADGAPTAATLKTLDTAARTLVEGREIDAAAIDAALPAVAAELGDLRQAARLPACVFERSYARGLLSTLVPESAPMVRAGRLLLVDAHAAARAGDGARAAADLATALVLAGWIADGSAPTSVGHLVMATMRRNTVAAAAPLLRDLPDEGLAALTAAAAELQPWRQRLARCLEAEEAMALETVGTLLGGGDHDDWPLFFDILITRNGGRALRHPSERLLAWALEPVYRVYAVGGEVAVMRRWHERVRRDLTGPRPLPLAGLGRSHDRLMMDLMIRDRGGVLARSLLPPLVRLHWEFAEGEAALAQLRAAIICERHRRATGAYPVAWSEVTAAGPGWPPADPTANGASLHVERLPDGSLRILAHGGDGDDDGGRLVDAKARARDLWRGDAGDGDMVMTLPARR